MSKRDDYVTLLKENESRDRSCLPWLKRFCFWLKPPRSIEKRANPFEEFRLPTQVVAADECPVCEPIPLKKSTKDIFLKDNKDIVELHLHDCYSITIMNCPKITKIPNMNCFTNLETIKIQHCTLHACHTYFPNSVRTLDISYCCMVDFSPENLPSTLAELDLSFNKLKSIPKIVENLYNANPSIRLNLRNNDLWYAMYSDLSPSLISADTIKELAFAHKINLVSTMKIEYAINILSKRKLTSEAGWLLTQVGQSLEKRRIQEHTTFANPQNVHLTSVQEGMKRAIDHIMTMNVRKLYIIHEASNILARENVSEAVLKFLNDCDGPDKYYHSVYKVAYKDLFEKVFSIVQESPYRKSLMEVLKDEINDGIGTCLTGQMSRLANILNGFVDGVCVSISKNEELSNSIVALRKKFAIMYGSDTSMYIQEAVPAIWQLLEDMCVPEFEQETWLEYV